MLDVLSREDPELRVAVGTAERLPLASEAFDFLFCVDVIHHVSDARAFFDEAARVLKESGTLCIVTDSEAIIRRRVPLATYFPETVEADLARYPRVATLRELAARSGFGSWRETELAFEREISSADAYASKAFSVLYLIPEAAVEGGVKRLEQDLKRGPLRAKG